MPIPSGAFFGVVAFTMLHDVPPAVLQDRLLAAARRLPWSGDVSDDIDGVDLDAGDSNAANRRYHWLMTEMLTSPAAMPVSLR